MTSISDSKTRRSISEKYRKRSESLCRKANELYLLTKAHIYLIIRRDGNYVGYQSTKDIVSAERKYRNLN